MTRRQKRVGPGWGLCHIEDYDNFSSVDVADNIDMLSLVPQESNEGYYSHEPPNTVTPSTNIDSHRAIPTENYKWTYGLFCWLL
jgi:hypothetical protein